MRTEGMEYIQVFSPGSFVVFSGEIGPGESRDVEIYTHWSDSNAMPHDWSVIAWAEERPLTVTHVEGVESSQFNSSGFEEQDSYPRRFAEYNEDVEVEMPINSLPYVDQVSALFDEGEIRVKRNHIVKDE